MEKQNIETNGGPMIALNSCSPIIQPPHDSYSVCSLIFSVAITREREREIEKDIIECQNLKL